MEESIQYLEDYKDFKPSPNKQYLFHILIGVLAIIIALTGLYPCLYLIALGYLIYSFNVDVDDLANLNLLVSIIYCVISIFINI